MKNKLLLISLLSVSSDSEIIESLLEKKSIFWGSVYFENKHEKFEVDQFGGNLNEVAGQKFKLI
jgi:hypothetical protein